MLEVSARKKRLNAASGKVKRTWGREKWLKDEGGRVKGSVVAIEVGEPRKRSKKADGGLKEIGRRIKLAGTKDCRKKRSGGGSERLK